MTNAQSSMEAFLSILKAKGLKATPQRLAVHEAMLDLGHASVDMVYGHICDAGKVRVTMSSVYNILSQLALTGIYSHRFSATNKMFFDVNTCRHIHIYDLANHEYRDIMDDELMSIVDECLRRRRFKGYKVDGFDIQIVCHPSHRKNSTTTKNQTL